MNETQTTAGQSTQFIDSKGRKWDATVDVPTVKTIRNTLKVDLMDLLNGKPDALVQLIDDPILLVDALYLICREQCQEKGINDEEFGRGLVGEGIDNAVDAFLVGVTYFFPKGRRAVALEVVRKIGESMDRVTTKALAALQDPNLPKAIDQQSDSAIRKFRSKVESLAAGGESSTS